MDEHVLCGRASMEDVNRCKGQCTISKARESRVRVESVQLWAARNGLITWEILLYFYMCHLFNAFSEF
jgi:predicted nucleic acid-binding Zn ribbon protein